MYKEKNCQNELGLSADDLLKEFKKSAPPPTPPPPLPLPPRNPPPLSLKVSRTLCRQRSGAKRNSTTVMSTLARLGASVGVISPPSMRRTLVTPLSSASVLKFSLGLTGVRLLTNTVNVGLVKTRLVIFLMERLPKTVSLWRRGFLSMENPGHLPPSNLTESTIPSKCTRRKDVTSKSV
ncbi:hypothetical protein BC829DRAFT_55159 [Chytridium lagenaria]|nr:hypothetical protein BC829DRAFT_55159 [Chytridium lagenaria]